MMRYYKDQGDGFYAVQDVYFVAPDEWTQITEAESQALMVAANAQSIPQSVEPLQALRAMYETSPALADAYDAWAADPARTFVQRAFINKAKTWRRDDQTLLDAAAVFGLTSEQVDALFILAATL
jgi:hypothetical protein